MVSKPVDQIPKDVQSVEDNGDGRPVNHPGVWVHDGSGAVLEALSQPAADAFLHLGFRPATESEVKDYDKRVEAAKQERLDVYKKQQESK